MPEKLLTLEEIASYLGVKEEVVIKLVDEGVLIAYKVGGEYLRFRKDQVDAVASEIKEGTKGINDSNVSEARLKVQEFRKMFTSKNRSSFSDWVLDFFYFYDFYIISAAVIVFLLMVIFKG